MPTTRAPASVSAWVQTGPRLPSAPVTTASAAVERALSRHVGRRTRPAPWRPRQRLFQQLERERLILGDGMPQRAPDEPVELVRRQAVARAT